MGHWERVPDLRWKAGLRDAHFQVLLGASLHAKLCISERTCTCTALPVMADGLVFLKKTEPIVHIMGLLVESLKKLSGANKAQAMRCIASPTLVLSAPAIPLAVIWALPTDLTSKPRDTLAVSVRSILQWHHLRSCQTACISTALQVNLPSKASTTAKELQGRKSMTMPGNSQDGYMLNMTMRCLLCF